MVLLGDLFLSLSTASKASRSSSSISVVVVGAATGFPTSSDSLIALFLSLFALVRGGEGLSTTNTQGKRLEYSSELTQKDDREFMSKNLPGGSG